jgi:hypothetical protein
MSERSKVWVAAWIIHWDAHPSSFGIVGVATTKEHAEQLFANEMVSEHGATMLDRDAYPDAQDWLTAIAKTCEDGMVDLSTADIEFLVGANIVHAPSEGA